MAKTRPVAVNERERGASLILVLFALSILMPLALILSDLVTRRQRQADGERHNLGGQAAVRGALEVATARLRSRRIILDAQQSEGFDLAEATVRPVAVRVTRQGDAVVTLDGRVLGPEEAEGLDLNRLGVDGHGRLVRHYRKLGVHLVDAEFPGPYPLPGGAFATPT